MPWWASSFASSTLGVAPPCWAHGGVGTLGLALRALQVALIRGRFGEPIPRGQGRSGEAAQLMAGTQGEASDGRASGVEAHRDSFRDLTGAALARHTS